MIDQEKVKKAVRLLLEGIGEDADREGLIETPDRIARMCEEIYGGYEEDAKEHLCKTFHVENSDMVVEKDITFYSMCEHHLHPLSFSINTSVAYPVLFQPLPLLFPNRTKSQTQGSRRLRLRFPALLLPPA